MDVADRARVHAALGDRHRLTMVDELLRSDRTFQELAQIVELPGNAAAHHLAVLEAAGLIERRTSEGDRRRKYISLRPDLMDGLLAWPSIAPNVVLFVCTHNSARSKFAAARWMQRTGGIAESAGTHPARRVHQKAVEAARAFDLDLSGEVPMGYDTIAKPPDLIVSVCDRARESAMPFDAPMLHWSVPDPVCAGTARAFRSAFATIAERVDRLASAAN